MLRAVLVAVAALAVLPACAAAAAPRGCGVPGDHRYTFGERTAVLHVPHGYAGRSLPLVIGLHGAGGDGPDFAEESGLSRESDRGAFAAVFPTAAGRRPFWNISRDPRGADDVAFVAALIDRLERTGCADRSRVYATGVSNGGGMAALLGCALSDRLAAIAPVAGGYKALPPCAPVRPLSVLEMHGTRDAVVPYKGVPPARLGSVPRFLVGWAQRDGCASTAQRSALARATVSALWTGCRDGVRVQGIKLYGVGHEWPDGAARTVWRFFASTPALPPG